MNIIMEIITKKKSVHGGKFSERYSKYWQLVKDYVKNLHDTRIRSKQFGKEWKVVRSNRARRIHIMLDIFLKGKHAKILDVGCGVGDIDIGLAKYGHKIIGVDTDRRAVEIAKVGAEESGVGVEFFKTDGGIPFDNEFDVIILNHAIEHLENHGAMLKKIHKLLKDKGIFYLTTANKFYPIHPHTGLPFTSWFDNELFSWHELKNLLEKTGFKVQNLTPYVIKNFMELYKDKGQHSAIKFKMYKFTSKFFKNEFMINLMAEVFTVVATKKLNKNYEW